MARKKLAKSLKYIADEYIQSLHDDGVVIRQAFVFGSRVSGQYHRDSDLDLAIISPNLHNSLSSTRYLLKRVHRLPSNRIILEPHGFHPSEFVDENPVVWEIKKTGIRLR